jgi:Zn finger protein HypA/HybF involved in hydrogenase expression
MSNNIINEYVRNFDDLIDVINILKKKYDEFMIITDKYIKLYCEHCEKEFYAEETAYQCPYCGHEDLSEL